MNVAAKSIARRGFSLIELVIVIVIIGIIAAIAIPRMSRGSTGASESSLRANLAVMRNAIELFVTEHENMIPGVPGALPDQLMKNTNIAGVVGTTTTEHIYGPYIREIPELPVAGEFSQRGSRGIAAANAANVGWIFTNPTPNSWVLKPNTGNKKDSRDVLFTDY